MDKLNLQTCKKFAVKNGYRVCGTPHKGYVLSYRADLNTLRVSEPTTLADIVEKINSNYLK